MVKSVKQQVKDYVNEVKKEDGSDAGPVISTGSTLLDLVISGGIVRGGGIPMGILVEVFGPAGVGKTVMLSEIAGNIQRAGGDVMFRDPESRLNNQFAKLFGMDKDKADYGVPNTVTELFKSVRDWETDKELCGIFADSITALSTDTEIDSDDGDKMGMRRAKELSQELRKTCRLIKERNYLMVCSNQIRQNINAGPYGAKFITSGGLAMEFYASLRLRLSKSKVLKRKAKIRGKEVVQSEGIEVRVNIEKSSVWKPSGDAIVSIVWDYGIDDIRDNLRYVKDIKKGTVYSIGDVKLGRGLMSAINKIETDNLEDKLRNEVIDLWTEEQDAFKISRKVRKRL